MDDIQQKKNEKTQEFKSLQQQHETLKQDVTSLQQHSNSLSSEVTAQREVLCITQQLLSTAHQELAVSQEERDAVSQDITALVLDQNIISNDIATLSQRKLALHSEYSMVESIHIRANLVRLKEFVRSLEDGEGVAINLDSELEDRHFATTSQFVMEKCQVLTEYPTQNK